MSNSRPFFSLGVGGEDGKKRWEEMRDEEREEQGKRERRGRKRERRKKMAGSFLTLVFELGWTEALR